VEPDLCRPNAIANPKIKYSVRWASLSDNERFITFGAERSGIDDPAKMITAHSKMGIKYLNERSFIDGHYNISGM